MKKERTKEQEYKHNQKVAKVLQKIAPIVFWVCISLAVGFLILAFVNSFGNIAEIIEKLNSKKFTGEELRNNYEQLVQKYGEWTIGNGGAGFTITFVDIKRALFSGIMISSMILSGVFCATAFVLGRWLLPRLSNQITQDNQDMVNMVVLKNADKNSCEKK